MTTLIQYTPAERKREFDLKYKSSNNIHFVIDDSHRGELPLVEVTTNGFNIVLTEYQKFNMQRRDDGPFWDHFYAVAGIPKSYDPNAPV